jgi:hypothetical protein
MRESNFKLRARNLIAEVCMSRRRGLFGMKRSGKSKWRPSSLGYSGIGRAPSAVRHVDPAGYEAQPARKRQALPPRLKHKADALLKDKLRPSEKQLRYAAALARRIKRPLPDECTSSRVLCSDFIADAKLKLGIPDKWHRTDRPLDRALDRVIARDDVRELRKQERER